MKEIELRSKVAAQARAWLGLRESDGSFKTIIDTYNSIKPLPGGYKMTASDPWCAAFVSAVGQACGLSDIIYPECNCDRMISLYRSKGKWVENDNYIPGICDLIMYDWQDTGVGDNSGEADHVGIVVSVNNASIVVIEGNKSNMVAYRTIQRNGRYIRGFCCPDYASKAATAAVSDPVEDKPAEDSEDSADLHLDPFALRAVYHDYEYKVKINLLKRGDYGPQVSNMQALLYCKGFGGLPTGSFDEATEKALIAFQTQAEIQADGEFGGESFARLWNWG